MGQRLYKRQNWNASVPTPDKFCLVPKAYSLWRPGLAQGFRKTTSWKMSSVKIMHINYIISSYYILNIFFNGFFNFLFSWDLSHVFLAEFGKTYIIFIEIRHGTCCFFFINIEPQACVLNMGQRLFKRQNWNASVPTPDKFCLVPNSPCLGHENKKLQKYLCLMAFCTGPYCLVP
jgi:hypothetical protein